MFKSCDTFKYWNLKQNKVDWLELSYTHIALLIFSAKISPLNHKDKTELLFCRNSTNVYHMCKDYRAVTSDVLEELIIVMLKGLEEMQHNFTKRGFDKRKQH